MIYFIRLFVVILKFPPDGTSPSFKATRNITLRWQFIFILHAFSEMVNYALHIRACFNCTCTGDPGALYNTGGVCNLFATWHRTTTIISNWLLLSNKLRLIIVLLFLELDALYFHFFSRILISDIFNRWYCTIYILAPRTGLL